MDVTKHIKAAIAAQKAPQGNRDAALLGSIFRYAKECGLTEYNPCQGATRAPEYARDREVDDALYLAVYELADPFLQVWMDLATMVGSRISDILRILDSDWKPAEGLRAIPAKAKPGQARVKQLFASTPDLVEVMDRAKRLKREALAAEARRKAPGRADRQHLPAAESGDGEAVHPLRLRIEVRPRPRAARPEAPRARRHEGADPRPRARARPAHARPPRARRRRCERSRRERGGLPRPHERRHGAPALPAAREGAHAEREDPGLTMMLAIEITLATIFTLAAGVAASVRVADDWDPDDGLPSWFTIGAIGAIALAMWISVAINR
jgi:hypothetical protein